RVQRKNSSRYRGVCARSSERQDRRHAGPYRPFTHHKLAFSFDNGGLTNFYPGYVCNRVEFSNVALKRNTQVPSPLWISSNFGNAEIRIKQRQKSHQVHRSSRRPAKIAEKPYRCAH